ncbi:MAG: esterase-like activity of phytase family protein [Phycisphaeraceae bacterium]|nr:MAG: esterase-like activity of phytase family protein [Phycisphaeraceae bacterium]
MRSLATLHLALLIVFTGCASQPQPELPLPTLDFLATMSIPSEHDALGTIGGLSGLTWTGEHFVAVSDHNERPMLYELALSLSPGVRGGDRGYDLDVTVMREIHLDHPAADAEAIVYDPNTGAWYIGYELPATVARLGSDPITFPLPDDVREGVRPNRSFESVTLRPNPHFGRPTELWAATETAITSDGEEATEAEGTLCRVLVWNPRTARLLRQYSYRTDPRPGGIPLRHSINSLVEFTTLPDGRLLALERSLTAPAGYGGRIFLIPGDSFEKSEAPFPVLSKRLLYDLSEVPLISIGNIEGMVVGPPISELTNDPREPGRLLLLIADDNFGRDIQRGSRVIALRITDLPD